MQYSREKLIRRYQQGEILKYVFFWGHTQKNPEIIDKSCFSQWYPSPFVVEVEASPMDTIWGIGLAQDNSQANDPTKWRGDNLLGFALMVVRDQLQQAEQQAK